MDADVIPLAEAVRQGDPERFRAVLAAPPELRAGLFTLYAFNLDLLRIAWGAGEPLLAEMRLQFWQDAFAGAGPERAIPGALGALIRRHDLPAEPFRRLVAARRSDHAGTVPQDLGAYLEDTAGALMELAALVTGAPVAAARDAGWAQGLALYLRALPELGRRGRRPDLDAVRIVDLACEGLARLNRARPRHPVLVSAYLARPYLRQVRRTPALVEGALALSGFGQSLALLRASLIGP